MSVEDRLYPLLAAWHRLPRAIQDPVGKVYRRLPGRVRLGPNFSGFAQLAREVEGWSGDRIADYQREQLRDVLRHAATTCPFYERAFADAGFDWRRLNSPADLERCPYITKEDLVHHRESMVSAAVPSRERLYITTGGSTGVPVGFYLHRGVSRPKEQAFLEAQWQRAGYFRGARVAVIRGHVTSSTAGGAIATYDAARDWLFLSSYHLTHERLPEYLDALEEFRPDFLHAYPSAALQLAQYLERTGCRTVPLRALLAGSERLTLPQKRLLEQVFGCRVFRWYGHSERVVLAAEGRKSEHFYFWPVYGFVEFGPEDARGLQEVIGTSFHNRAMPLIRYRTGDYVRVVEPSSDGSAEFPWPAVSAVEGRGHEFLVGATGRLVSLTAINMHDRIFDNLYGVQFFQEQQGRTEFRYLPGPRFDDSQLPAIASGLRTKLGDDFDLTLRPVSDIEKTANGKQRWLISQLPRDTMPD